MREIFSITKRNCFIFFRDKSTVFFSLLSMIIILGLSVVFLGSMNSRTVVDLIEQYGSRVATAQDKDNAAYLIQMWTLAGILVVNAVTVSLTAMGRMVQDETEKRIMAFYVTPVKRLYIALGYIISAWFIGIVMCILTLAAGELYFICEGYGTLEALELLKMTAIIVGNTFVFSALGYLLALFVHSNSAWSGLLTVIGTVVGFAGGIYLPMSQLSDGVQKILKCLPVLHGTAMMRAVCTEAILEKTFAGMPVDLIPVYKEKMGITITAGNNIMSTGDQILILAGYAVVTIVLSVIITRNRKLKDR